MSKKTEKGPKYISSPLNNPMINYCEYYMSAFEKVSYSLVAFVLGGLASQVFYGGLFKVDGEVTTLTHISNMFFFIIVGLVSVKVFLPAFNNMLKEKRSKILKHQFSNFLEALSTSISSGNTLYSAMQNSKQDLLNQYSEKDYIVIELSEILSGVDNGKTMEQMLESFGTRSGNEDILNFSNVISNCYRLGGNFNDVIRRTREVVMEKFAISDEIETKISSNKMQLNAMSIMPIALVAMLKMSSSDFAANLSSFLGVVVSTIAIGIFVAAYFWGQKIINIR